MSLRSRLLKPVISETMSKKRTIDSFFARDSKKQKTTSAHQEEDQASDDNECTPNNRPKTNSKRLSQPFLLTGLTRFPSVTSHRPRPERLLPFQHVLAGK